MGIIRNLKALYRKSIISRIVAQIDAGSSVTVTDLSRQVTLLDALHMLRVAWNNVKGQSVANCFAKAGFVTPATPVEEESLDPPDGMTFSQFECFVDMDNTVECVGELTDQDICDPILNAEGGSARESDDEEDLSETRPMPNQRDTVQAMHVVRLYLENCGADLQWFYTLEGQVLQLASTTWSQTLIKDFSPLPSPEY